MALSRPKGTALNQFSERDLRGKIRLEFGIVKTLVNLRAISKSAKIPNSGICARFWL
jgi:hypothetical protein